MHKTLYMVFITSSSSRVPVEKVDRKHFLRKGSSNSMLHFYDQHFGSAKPLFVSKDRYNAFQSVVQSARTKLEQYAVKEKKGQKQNLFYMTEEIIDEYEFYYKQFERKFEQLLEEMKNEYESDKKKFLEGVGEFIDDPIEKDKVLKITEAEIVSVRSLLKKFEMEFVKIPLEDVKISKHFESLFIQKSIHNALDLLSSINKAFDSGLPKKMNRALFSTFNEKMEKINLFNITNNKSLQDVIKDFYSIKDYEGKGTATATLLKEIKEELRALNNEYL